MCTSVLCPFHVEPCLIRHKIFRPCFLSSIVELADFLTNMEVIALARNFFVALEKAIVRPSNLVGFKRVTSEVHLPDGVFHLVTLASSFKDTNPGHQKRN